MFPISPFAASRFIDSKSTCCDGASSDFGAVASSLYSFWQCSSGGSLQRLVTVMFAGTCRDCVVFFSFLQVFFAKFLGQLSFEFVLVWCYVC